MSRECLEQFSSLPSPPSDVSRDRSFSNLVPDDVPPPGLGAVTEPLGLDGALHVAYNIYIYIYNIIYNI